jgi:FtsH-binding integral membrane protein
MLYWLKRIFWRKKWKHPANFAVLSFVFTLVALSFSRFKMPHYIVMLFPLVTIFAAPYLRHVLSYRKGTKVFFPLQLLFSILVVLAAIVLNFYFFKPASWSTYLITVLLTGLLLLLTINRSLQKAMKIIYISALGSLLFNFLLYYNFFPQLLKYQAGNEMVHQMKEKNIVIPDEQIMLIDPNAHSFDFYRGHCHPLLTPEELENNYTIMKDSYFLINRSDRNNLESMGFRIEPVISQRDYNVARVSLKFLNKASREQKLDTLMLAKIYRN